MQQAVADGEVDFLLGGESDIASVDSIAAQITKRSTILCCHGPPTVYIRSQQQALDENTSNWLFGIHRNSELYTDKLIRNIVINRKAKNIAVVVLKDLANPNNTVFTRTTGEAAIKQLQAMATTFKTRDPPKYTEIVVPTTMSTSIEYFRKLARNMSVAGVDVVLGCTLNNDGKLLIQALNELKVPLRALFVTVTPTIKESVASLSEQGISAEYVLSAGQWHPELQYTADIGQGEIEDDPGEYLWLSAGDFAEKFSEYVKSLTGIRGEASYIHASAAAAGLAVQLAVGGVFNDNFFCFFTNTTADTVSLTALLEQESWTCEYAKEYQYSGYGLIRSNLQFLDEGTFFGRIAFNSKQQNEGSDSVTFQLLESVDTIPRASQAIDFGPLVGENTSARLIQEVVLPSQYETKSLVLPRPPLRGFFDFCDDGYGLNKNNDCEQCDAGFYRRRFTGNNSIVFFCLACNLTRYQPFSGQSSCLTCPENTVTAEAAAVSITDCTCSPGFYNPGSQNGTACLPCPEGARCPGGDAKLLIEPGYWSEPFDPARKNASIHVFACDPGSVCVNTGEEVCQRGYGGNLCSQCGWDNHDPTTQNHLLIFGKCVRCVSPAVNLFIFIAMFGAWLLVNLFVTNLVQSLALFTAWMQLMSLVGEIRVNWPKSLTTFFSVASFFAFEVDVVSLRCFDPTWNFLSDMILQYCLPLGLIFALCVWSWLKIKVLYKLKKSFKHTQQGSGSGDQTPEEAGRRQTLQWVALEKHGMHDNVSYSNSSVSDRKQEKLSVFGIARAKVLASQKTEAINREDVLIIFGQRVFSILETTYLASTLYALSALRYIEVGGKKVVARAPATMWSSAVIVLGSVGLAFYAILFPLVMFFVLWSWSPDCPYRKRPKGVLQEEDPGDFQAKKSLTLLGWLYSDFRAEVYYMSFMHIPHRLCFAVSVTLITNPGFQLLISIIVTVFFALLFILKVPYYNHRLNVLQITMYTSILLQLALGVCYASTGDIFSENWSTAFTFISFTLIVIVVCVLIWIISMDLLEYIASVSTKSAIQGFYTAFYVEDADELPSEIESLIDMISAPKLWSWVLYQWTLMRPLDPRPTPFYENLKFVKFLLGKRPTKERFIAIGKNLKASLTAADHGERGLDGITMAALQGHESLQLFIQVSQALGNYSKKDGEAFSYLNLRDEAELWRELVLDHPEIVSYLFNEENNDALNAFFAPFYRKYWRTQESLMQKALGAFRSIPTCLFRSSAQPPATHVMATDEDGCVRSRLLSNRISDSTTRLKNIGRNDAMRRWTVRNVAWLIDRRDRATIARWLATRNWDNPERKRFAELVLDVSSLEFSCWQERTMKVLSLLSMSIFLVSHEKNRKTT
ncbi:hypothetical protein Ndes2437B_g06475 [Nannochloris sp. 'desiccata']